MKITPKRSTEETPREALIRAARALFPQRGFTHTSVRALATEAGVDPTLVARHFGSKEALFIESVIPVVDSSQPPLWTLGTQENLGHRIVEQVVQQAPVEKNTYVAILRASDNDDIRAHLHDIAQSAFTAPLLALLDGPRRELKAHLITAQLSGLQTAMHAQGDAALADSDASDVIDLYGKAIQAIIDA